MNPFSAAELTAMRTAQQEAMQDTAYVQTHTQTSDSMGAPVHTYTDAATTIVCGLDMRPGSERHTAQDSQTQYDATARLPIATIITTADRLKIIKRFGETLATALVFDVVGPVQRGPSGIRVLLKKVEL